MTAPPQQQPRIRVRKATHADIDDLVRINDEAFRPGIINRLMYPDGKLSAVAKNKVASMLAAALDSAGAEVDGASHASKPKAFEEAVVVAEIVPQEPQTPAEIIAMARYTIRREPQPEEEWNIVQPLSAYTTEGANDEVMEAFMGSIHDMRQRNMRGDPAMWLRSLVCSPKWSRMGAGSALLRYGADLADREGLPTWIEASPVGYRLYRRFGFEDVEVLDLDIARWGAVRGPDETWGAESAVDLAGPPAEGVYRSVQMLRLPSKEP